MTQNLPEPPPDHQVRDARDREQGRETGRSADRTAEHAVERAADRTGRAGKRASDADRDQVVERLRDAAAEGRLDLAEFDERMGIAYQTRTYGELDRLTGDLPEIAGAAPPPAEVVLRAHGSAVRREGRWLVPRRLVIQVKHGAVRLDLTAAVVPAAEVEIEIDATHSSVVLLVPAGTQTVGDSLDAAWSSVKYGAQECDDGTRGPGFAGGGATTMGPRLRLTGSARHSAVAVRRPRFFESRIGRLRAWWRRVVHAG